MDTRVTVLGQGKSVLNHFLRELRDHEIQQDRMRFRRNLERVGEIMAYEISKQLPYHSEQVSTPLGELDMNLMDMPPVLVSVLRAGLPFHQGFLNMFDEADNGFIAAYRHTTKGNDFVVKVEYAATPELSGRTLILVDPMIATGRSLVLSYREITEDQEPDQVIVAGVIASEEGVEYVLRHIPQAKIYVGGLDHELTAKSYIVPGLGDAGDLAFGPK